ncbi:MAG: T9SS type A sorting domain-containing protein [Bacteroidetes bacterium]|nr:T9SS type A sorting domain-containing protein [Bacteroidota bacterium]MBT3422540.1 T9SS type A sorting domain-containing protein [Bacteroidota bacterium]MBT3934672.1 T9SS type A sorting domain-containing protein [Bacteroidota bacterium]MBT4337152.1 T9SS type A sorting domain-containing protein [Bacteroidota bacterium]MBT4730076.1 T9SS type A sorting domain-containing protein [Bacteroidota bacterium]
MKNFTKLFFALLFGFISMNTFAADRLELTEIVAPVINSDVILGQPTEFEFKMINNSTATFTTVDTAILVIGWWNGSQVTGLQLLGGYMPTSDLVVGDSVNFKFTLTFPTTMTPGQYAPVFGVVWSGNPEPTKFSLVASVYNFTLGSGVAEKFASLDKAYYSNGYVNIDINSNGNAKAYISVSNTNGQIVYGELLSMNNRGLSSESIYVGNLPKGIYILGLSAEGRLTTKKFMVY